MGGAVFADGDGVVRGNVYDLERLQGRHADCGRRVQGEHEKCRGDGDDRAGVVGREAVGYGRHGVLSGTVVDVPTTVRAFELDAQGKIGLSQRLVIDFHIVFVGVCITD